MAGQRQPTNLLITKGNKHFSKAEIEARLKSEITFESEAIMPPKFLSAVEKKEFERLSKRLSEIGIMTDIDADVLGRYIVSKKLFERYSKLILTKIRGGVADEKLNSLESFTRLQSSAFKQCHACAGAMGLTISSRCKIVGIPKPEEKKANKFDEYIED